MSVRDVVQAAAGALGGAVTYVEDVFSTYLYTGNGTSQTITNGIDLAGEGGMVWLKPRSEGYSHKVYDTARGTNSRLYTNTTDAAQTGYLTSFNSDGFSKNYDLGENTLDQTYASWTFRKAPKFFDVVTWVGDGTDNRLISHSLESAPGAIFIKRTSGAGDWWVKHRSLAEDGNLTLNSTSAVETKWDWNPTSTTFDLGISGWGANFSGSTYVAYLFAHDAGGFGDDGQQNVISCGSVTADGSGNATATLGYEPQFILLKSTSTGDWYLMDQMRGWTAPGSSDAFLRANNAFAEGSTPFMSPSATGFTLDAWVPSETFVYVAIRRGPMKTPESGTEVFAVDTRTTGNPSYSSGFPVDMGWKRTVNAGSATYVASRLTGTSFLATASTAAESTDSGFVFDYMDGWAEDGLTNSNVYSWMFRRAPGFFSVVAYTGDSVAGRTVAHNLGVAPELMVVKVRNDLGQWPVYNASIGAGYYMNLDNTDGANSGTFIWNGTAPTNTVFTVGSHPSNNGSGYNYVAYLFASCPGVSKVGSYTGTGTTQAIDCGFSAGARFVLIKRTDSTGDWYFWDSARGIVSGNDPYLLLNSTAAENTSTDYIDPSSAGFEISSSAPAAINASGGSFIFFAVA